MVRSGLVLRTVVVALSLSTLAVLTFLAIKRPGHRTPGTSGTSGDRITTVRRGVCCYAHGMRRGARSKGGFGQVGFRGWAIPRTQYPNYP